MLHIVIFCDKIFLLVSKYLILVFVGIGHYGGIVFQKHILLKSNQ